MADVITATEKLYGVKLPSEYVRFLKSKSYEKHDNRFCPLLEGGRDTQRLRFFVGADIHGVPGYSFHNLDDLRDENPNLIPFAAFDADGEGEIDSGALVIDVTKEKAGKCPVYQADDGELEKVAGSIEELLASLTDEEPDDEDDEDDDDEDDEDEDDDE